MRSALLCVFFALIGHKEGCMAAEEDFRPTPIPINDWNGGNREGTEAVMGMPTGAGTLHEVIATDAPPVVAVVPAHYWEDALRHSVYLTLVRDKIDQLIAKGSVISPDTKPDHPASKEVDDHDLWEKIKSAPFDRLDTEEPAYLGDITIISKGRLLEEKSGLRFTEDELSKEKCIGQNCTEDVKAYWSVKRMRQRDAETTPGTYHYELTFSVSSQTQKKQTKPYENPVRTFTVREGTPVERPQYRAHEPPPYGPRPQRAVWFHKNIVPTAPHQNRDEEDSLDRLFSSLFSLDDEPPVKRYKQVSYVPQMYPQRSKVGHVGTPADQHNHNQKPSLSYPSKSHHQTSHKYGRPPLGPQPVSHQHSQHHYIDLESIRNQNQYTAPQSDYKYFPTNIVKTTKHAVLPTPPISYAPLNMTMEVAQHFNATESTPKDPEIITAFTTYSKPRPQPTKINYFPEHVRPPIFNAPPGVFVTMDKKPFKPMPPLKYLHSQNPNKHKPVDFRPSPQVLDAQFSDPLSVPSTDAFRPIMSYGAGKTTTVSSEVAESDIRAKPLRKTKPPKKHDNIKSHRTTTSVPEIITAHNEILEEMHWANILGAFAKTTPMVSHKMNVNDTTTPLPSTTVSSTTTVLTPNTTEVEMTRTTTKSSKLRRTRPPPKFAKPVKVKKHKRVTSTTTTSTTSTTTGKPYHRRPTQDLTPQASSAPSGATKSTWEPINKIQNASVSTTMSPNVMNITVTSTTPVPSTTSAKIDSTTYRTSTTTRQKATIIEAPSTSIEMTTTISNTHPKIKENRYRQSTLMYKGTSVKHDKWSSPNVMEKNKAAIDRAKLAHPQSGNNPRRKGSNFQGYASSNRKVVDEERNREDHVDHVFNPNLNVISLTTTSKPTTDEFVLTSKTMQATYEDSAEQNEKTELDDAVGTEDPDKESDDSEDVEDDTEDTDDQGEKDKSEYIFNASSKQENSSETNLNLVATTEDTVVTTEYAIAKNKTKCKKKQNQSQENNLTSKSTSDESKISVASIEITTEKLSTADFFNQIFGMTVDQNEADGKHTESKYVDNDEDLEEFLESINRKKDNNDTNEDEYEAEDKDDDEENSPFNNDEENRFARNADGSYEDYQERPYSLIELMAME